MKGKRLVGLGIGLASYFSIFLVAQTYPAWALDTDKDAAFIDKDFEQAVCKHFQKRFFNLIDASDSQRSQISAILDERREETQPQREKLRGEAIQLSELMASDASDQKVLDKVHELRDLRNKLMDERVQTALKVRTLLKPNQRKAVSDKIVSFLNGNVRPHMLR